LSSLILEKTLISYGFIYSFSATLISIISLSRIAYKQYDKLQPRTLSQLAAAQDRLLRYFRTTLVICGLLFAVSLYGFIIPSLQSIALAIAWSVTLGGNLLAAILPARGKTNMLHEISARLMALAMIAMAYIFSVQLTGVSSIIERGIAIVLPALALGTIVNTRRFISYELAFIYLSHISIVTAAISIGRASGCWV
jgi:hypothetical protein